MQTQNKFNSIQELLKSNSGIRLDLGGGGNPQPGFVNMDVRDLPTVDIVHDFTDFPWPLPDECVILAVASHLIEHIPRHNFIFMNFMNELWRVTKPGGSLMIAMPYCTSPGYYQDPTHVNPCNETTFAYFDPLHQSQLWQIYKPMPWYYKFVSFDPAWSLEAQLMRHSKDDSLWAEERDKWNKR